MVTGKGVIRVGDVGKSEWVYGLVFVYYVWVVEALFWRYRRFRVGVMRGRW